MMDEEIVYVCGSCGERFTLADGKHVESDEGAYTLCPWCGSSDIEEAERCHVCRGIVLEYETEGGVCPECFEEAKNQYKEALETLPTWVREALDLYYGNIDVTEE